MKAATTPCESCPWLRQNQTPQAVQNSPVDARGVHWFALSNLRDRWRFVARGGMLPCHATDRRAPLYGGKATPAKEGRVCIGLATLAQREILHFMQCGMDPAKHRQAKGLRFSVKALAMWAGMLLHSGSIIQAPGSPAMRIPKPRPNPGVITPWPDEVHNP